MVEVGTGLALKQRGVGGGNGVGPTMVGGNRIGP